jgi:hypothetical protein
MIARHRGDLRVHSGWRPSTATAPPSAPAAAENNGDSSSSGGDFGVVGAGLLTFEAVPALPAIIAR